MITIQPDPFFRGGISKNSGNLLITFKAPVKVDKLYGTSKEVDSILMNIDDFELFAQTLLASLAQRNSWLRHMESFQLSVLLP